MVLFCLIGFVFQKQKGREWVPQKRAQKIGTALLGHFLSITLYLYKHEGGGVRKADTYIRQGGGENGAPRERAYAHGGK